MPYNCGSKSHQSLKQRLNEHRLALALIADDFYEDEDEQEKFIDKYLADARKIYRSLNSQKFVTLEQLKKTLADVNNEGVKACRK